MYLKPSPRLPMSSPGARSKESAAVTDAVVPELLLDALELTMRLRCRSGTSS